ncbi:MAG: SAM-dependent methyltransferase [Lutibacter sp.]|uniref:hypothetical protein n=1 Tax=Lutibacter sp. TaxID=1925666 RepID=UPI0019EC30CA|nr:hypothetical protein [Lutibacter sp.]NOR27527.1 SAM-dependent methyltransferase [Lutibacter sp.]
MKIKEDVANVLANSIIEDNKLFLPDTQLERKLYTDVSKVLVVLKGKWNRSAKAHVFAYNPTDMIEEVLLTGEYVDDKKIFQFFETPELLALKLIYLADIKDGETLCEPSAGKGRIAQYLTGCDKIELNPECTAFLQDNMRNLGGEIIQADFLTTTKRYDVFIANPPFAKQQDIDHVNHMINLANRKVISIMSANVLWRDNKKTIAFRERVESLGGEFTLVDDGAFKESGTMVKTCIVNIDIPQTVEEKI